jgi:hypothetical protein
MSVIEISDHKPVCIEDRWSVAEELAVTLNIAVVDPK